MGCGLCLNLAEQSRIEKQKAEGTNNLANSSSIGSTRAAKAQSRAEQPSISAQHLLTKLPIGVRIASAHIYIQDRLQRIILSPVILIRRQAFLVELRKLLKLAQPPCGTLYLFLQLPHLDL